MRNTDELEERAEPMQPRSGQFLSAYEPHGDRPPGSAQGSFEQSMRLAGVRLEAADVLACVPYRAESARVLARALDALEAAAAALVRDLPNAPSFDKELEATCRSRATLETLPEVESELTAQDFRGMREARAVAAVLRGRLREASQTRRAGLARRILPPACVALASVLAFVAWRYVAGLRDRFDVTASDYYDRKHPPSAFRPECALDGDPATEWLAPDDENGWLDVSFSRETHVTGVRIQNARNGSFLDRASKRLTVELYRGKELVRSAPLSFPPIDKDGQTPPEVAQLQGEGITRVRVIVTEHYGKGAGLAEIEILEAP